MPLHIEVTRADITTLEVDAIVNAANERMLGGGGVDGAIHRAAGPDLLDECRHVAEAAPGVRCPTGEARITMGHRLPARYVIHTAGPRWTGGDDGEAALLASCYRSCMLLADGHECGSMAFPAISCGIFGYPVDRACDVALTTIRAWEGEARALRRIVLSCFDDEVHDTYERRLAR